VHSVGSSSPARDIVPYPDYAHDDAYRARSPPALSPLSPVYPSSTTNSHGHTFYNVKEAALSPTNASSRPSTTDMSPSPNDNTKVPLHPLPTLFPESSEPGTPMRERDGGVSLMASESLYSSQSLPPAYHDHILGNMGSDDAQTTSQHQSPSRSSSIAGSHLP